LFLYKAFDNSDEAAEMLPLSTSDMKRLKEITKRHITIPILIADSILPGQRINFSSNDKKFGKLLEYVLENSPVEIGMIGFNPHTGDPLNMGSTLAVTDKNVIVDPASPNLLAISARANRRFVIDGEPRMDETSSFYLADVEIVDNKVESISNDEKVKAQKISSTIPNLVDTWTKWIVNNEKFKKVDVETLFKTIGPMPDEVCERAIWVASLVNPLPSINVCPEVRPAMLACRNDYERIILAATAIQSSIDHISGKRTLF